MAIPTYNRARKAERQAANLIEQVDRLNLRSLVEILVLDNASTDDTKDRIAKYAESGALRYIRADRNTGLVGNYIRCIEEANGRFTWTVGDDDELMPNSLQLVSDHLKHNTTRAALFLNLNQRDGISGRTSNPCYYPTELQIVHERVPGILKVLTATNHSSWLWMTGTVVSTEHARAALNLFPTKRNLATPFFVATYVASCGNWEIPNQVATTMVTGTTSWARTHYRRLYALDLPIALLRLKDHGIDLTNLQQFEEILTNRWVALFGDIRRRGITTLVDWWLLQRG